MSINAYMSYAALSAVRARTPEGESDRAARAQGTHRTGSAERAATALQAVRTCFALGRGSDSGGDAPRRRRRRRQRTRNSMLLYVDPGAGAPSTALCIKCAWHAHWRSAYVPHGHGPYVLVPLAYVRTLDVCVRSARARSQRSGALA